MKHITILLAISFISCKKEDSINLSKQITEPINYSVIGIDTNLHKIVTYGYDETLKDTTITGSFKAILEIPKGKHTLSLSVLCIEPNKENQLNNSITIEGYNLYSKRASSCPHKYYSLTTIKY